MADSNLTIEGMVALPGPSQVILQWVVNDPNEEALTYLRYDKAEIWRSSSSNMANAVKLGEAYTAFLDQPVRLGRIRYYQVRARNRSGQLGAFSPIVASGDNSQAAVPFETPLPPSFVDFAGRTIAGGARGYFIHKSGLVFQWGTNWTQSNGEAVAYFNTTNARFLPFNVRCHMSHDDGYPGEQDITDKYEVRKPTLKELNTSGGFGQYAIFQVRRHWRTRGGSGIPITLDPYEHKQEFGIEVPPRADNQGVNWMAIGVRA